MMIVDVEATTAIRLAEVAQAIHLNCRLKADASGAEHTRQSELVHMAARVWRHCGDV
jgi:hypothetical protein